MVFASHDSAADSPVAVRLDSGPPSPYLDTRYGPAWALETQTAQLFGVALPVFRDLDS